MCANTELISGVSSYLMYGEEGATTFGTKASSINKSLGLVTSFNPKHNRNAKEHRGFIGSTSGGQEAVKTTSGRYEGSFSIEFTPLEWGWMENVLGSVSAADGTAGTPFVYSRASNPVSLTFIHAIDNVTTDRNEIYLGSRISSLSIRAALGEVVTCTLEGTNAAFDKASTLDSNIALPTGEVFNFAGATLELPDSSAISHTIESMDIQINRTVQSKHGFGTFVGKISKYGQIEYRVNFTVVYLDEEFLDDLMGSATTLGANPMTNNATLTVKFQSLADSNRFAEFKFTNVTFPQQDNSNALNEFMTEGITGFAQTLTVEETTAA